MGDTIAAVATGGGVSAIGIVRISGGEAIGAAEKLFSSVCGTKLRDAENRHMYYGELVGADGGLIDLCLCAISRGPSSYTGEDTVEFQCHGSPIVLSEVLLALFSLGVRAALPGEFTKRAFLNGRMDLTQAEAVIDLIEAETPIAAQNAVGQLMGAVGKKLDTVYDMLLDVMAHFHAVIDYPDEDIDEFEMQGYLHVLTDAEDRLAQMLSTYERGKVMRDGIPTAIIGRPNTGKSSLLNALLGFDRAIVTDSPGTTRDTIEEKVLFGGILLRLIDTAGIRKTNDTIEQLGVDRALDAVKMAGLAIVVLDGSEPLREEDFDALRSIPSDVPVVFAVNKSDLPQALTDDELLQLTESRERNVKNSFSRLSTTNNEYPAPSHCHICAINGKGLDTLEEAIKKTFPDLTPSPPIPYNLDQKLRPDLFEYCNFVPTPYSLLPNPCHQTILTNARQADAIMRAKEGVTRAIEAIAASTTPDAVLTDIEEALAAIGETTGKTMREDIVSRIFERFCVGK